VTDTIVINFIDAESPIKWAKFGDGIQQETGAAASLDELAEQAQLHQLIVWVSSDKLSFTTATIPTGQQRHIDKILPSILEDNLASDIDQLHFVTGSVSNDELSVIVVEQSEISDCLEQFNTVGLKPQALLPDSLAIPLYDGQWSLFVDGDVSQLRTASQMSHMFDTQNLSTLLGLIPIDKDATLSVYASDEQRPSLNLQMPVDWRGQTIDRLSTLPNKAVMAMNLLQGEFKPQSNVQKYWQQWKRIAVLAIVALCLQLIAVGIETWQLNQQVKSTKAEIKNVFHKAFPDEKRMVNVKAQAMQRMAQLQSQQGGMGFLILLQKISPALKSSENISLSRINFEHRLRTMNLDIKAQDYAQLEQLKMTIDKLGLTTELGSVSGSKGAYTARLMIRSQQ